MSDASTGGGRIVGRIDPASSGPDPAEAYREHRVALFNYFCRCGLPRPASEDQLQAVFVVLLENLNRFDPVRSTLKSFLFGIARNQRMTWLRKNPRDDGEVVPPQPVDVGTASAVIVRQAVERLPDDQREALILREFHGFDYEEIARFQEIPVGTVRSRLFRARETLRRQLRPGEEDTP